MVFFSIVSTLEVRVLKKEKMDRRTADILTVIIEEYVNSAEPVGSKNIVDKYSMGVSSATVRNEMHDLEEEGYITSIHTSSGRIPTDKGYRFYVDYLTEYIKQKETEEKIYKLLKMVEINDALDLIFNGLLKNNPYTTIGALKRNGTRIDTFHILSVAKDTYLIIVILKNSNVVHKIINEQLSENVKVNILSEYLNEKLYDMTLQDIQNANFVFIDKFDRDNKAFFIKAVSEVMEILHQYEENEVYLKGKENLLSFPDFKDVMEMKNIFHALDSEGELSDILLSPTDDAFSAMIGAEIKNDDLAKLSIAKHTYDLGAAGQITFGLVGPTRMDYRKVMNSLNNIENMLNELLERKYEKKEV